MKKKILSFVLAICLIIPAIMFVGCGNDGYNKVGDYYLKYEQSIYTGNSIQLVMSVKNDKSYPLSLEPNAFTLQSTSSEYYVTGLSVDQGSHWNTTFVRVNVDPGQTVRFKLIFGGAGLYGESYSLNYYNTNIANVSQGAFNKT